MRLGQKLPVATGDVVTLDWENQQPATGTAPPWDGRPRPVRPRNRTARLLGVTGGVCVAVATLILLYLAYSLFFTGLTTSAAQRTMLDAWELDVGPIDAPEGPSARDSGNGLAPAEAGDAVAIMEFRRPGSTEPLVRSGPLLVVEGVTRDDLMKGPGRYPGTGLPGQGGNFAVAGHRTTYGAPFFNLDQLRAGDEVLVTDRLGARWTYRVVAQRVVGPNASSVIGPDPLAVDRPTLTLTTCHPRFSARQRLIVHAVLVSGT